MNKAKFIVIEGLEGAGKSTAISVVKNWLKKQGIEQVITTREPGGTPIAEKLRTIVKDHKEKEKLLPISELLLMYAARVQLVKNIIEPALAEDTWVIGDRHELSTRAYQGGGRGIPLESLEKLHSLCLQDFKPHLTLYLDIPPSLGFKRIKSRAYTDRIEQESLEFFERARSVYRSYLNEKEAIIEVNASQPIKKVHADIEFALEKYCL
jgi:dTMP kinase